MNFVNFDKILLLFYVCFKEMRNANNFFKIENQYFYLISYHSLALVYTRMELRSRKSFH